MCVGQEDDVRSLREALASAQPASAAENQQRLAAHLASSATKAGLGSQHTDQANPGNPAPLSQPGAQPPQLPIWQQALYNGKAPPPEVAAAIQPPQEDSAGAPLTVSAALAATDQIAGGAAAGRARKRPTPDFASLPEQPAAKACGVGPDMDEVLQLMTAQTHSFLVATLPELQCSSQGNITQMHRPGQGKTRPPRILDILSRQAAEAKKRMLMHEQHRPQVAHEAAPVADSPGDTAAVGVAKSGACAKRVVRRRKRRPPTAGPSPHKQHAAAGGRQPSRKRKRTTVPDPADNSEMDSAQAAKVRLQLWMQEQGKAGMVPSPRAAAEMTVSAPTPAKASVSAVRGAASRSKCQIRQPYAEAMLAVPLKLADMTKEPKRADQGPWSAASQQTRLSGGGSNGAAYKADSKEMMAALARMGAAFIEDSMVSLFCRLLLLATSLLPLPFIEVVIGSALPGQYLRSIISL